MTAPAPAPPRCCLEVGEPVAGHLGDDGLERWSVELRAGDVLDVLVHQDAADLAILLLDPSGNIRLRLDTPTDDPEPERLVFVAQTGGRHALEIEALAAETDAPYRLDVRALRPATPADRLLARAVGRLAEGHELRRGGRLEEAVKAYRAAAEAWGDIEDAAEQANAQVWAGICLSRSGRSEEAESVLRSVADGLNGTPHLDERATALGQLGLVLRDRGRIDDAVVAFEEALDLSRSTDDRTTEAATLTRLANLEKARGQMGAAVLRYEEVLDLWRRLDHPRDEAITLANLAGIYGLTGHADLARDLLLRAQARLPHDADDADRAFLQGELGLVERRRGDHRAAIRAYERALALSGDQESPAALPALHGLGLLYEEAGEHERAAERFRRALAIADATDNRLWQGLVLQNLGWSHLHRGQNEEALDLFARALPILKEVELRSGEATALTGIGRIERERGHLEAAASWAERALAAVEEVRSGSDRPDMRAALLAARRAAFDSAVATYVELDRRDPGEGHAGRAFEASERGRARWLLDAMPARGESSSGSENGPSGPEVERPRLRVQRAETERLRLLADGASRPALEQSERELRSALEDLRAATPLPPDREARETLGPVSLREIRRTLLKPGTLLLSVHLGEERSHLFAISTEALEVFELPPRDALEAQARQVHRLLSQSDRRAAGLQAERAAAELSHVLLGSLGRRLERFPDLVVSLDGALHAVPIGALPHPISGQPLLAEHRVRHVPSLSVGTHLERRAPIRSQPDGPLLAVVADPVYSASDRRAEPTAGARTDSEGSDGLSFERLRHAEREAEAVLALVEPSRRKAWLGFAAGKDQLASGLLARFPFVHFAAHGRLNDEHPELSALVLSRIDEQGRRRDGFLWAHEIAELELSAELVVASACDTGLGAEIGGEGLVGLSHAFFRAGASRALVSLWPVADAAAPDLMERFYRGFLRDGLTPAEALRRAQLAIRDERRWERPYFWAGWVLHGKG